MDRYRQNVIPAIEDVLGAVAVMIIVVDDGDLTPFAKLLGGDGGIVEITEPSEGPVSGVMTGRAAEGVGYPTAGQDLVHRGQNHVDSRQHRLIGVAVERGEGVHAVVLMYRRGRNRTGSSVTDRTTSSI